MSKLSEKNGVEVPIYEWLGKMGWQCRTNDELKGYGRQFSNTIIDFENVWDNDFTVTRQYWVQGVELVKPDLVCLINGIPLVPFEAKQRAQQSSDWMKGVRDLSLAKRSPIRHKLSPNELRLFGDTYRFVHDPSLRFETDVDYRGHLLRAGIDLVDPELRKRWYRRFARGYLNQRVGELSRSNGFKFNRLYVDTIIA